MTINTEVLAPAILQCHRALQTLEDPQENCWCPGHRRYHLERLYLFSLETGLIK